MPSRRTRLSAARRAAGYSQEALAEQLGVDRSTVQRWESGEVAPQPAQQTNLATALNMTSDVVVDMLCIESSRAYGASQVQISDLLDHTRSLVDNTLSATTISPGRLDLIDERVVQHLAAYTRTAPSVMLSALVPDIVDVQTIAAARQPAMVQSRLSGALAILGLLTADGLMKLGETVRSRYWYSTARLAADDTDNMRLRACIRAQEAMLPYYYGRVEDSLKLARSAQELLPGTPSHATALAAAAEGRALARLGDLRGAERAMSTAQRYVDRTDSPDPSDAAFRFNEKRLLLYLSGTLTYMGEFARARRVQEEALRLYGADPDLVIDPALIKLDQAIGRASLRQVDESCELAADVVTTLPAEHRTRIVLARVKDVVRALPGSRQQWSRAVELNELVAAQPEGIR